MKTLVYFMLVGMLLTGCSIKPTVNVMPISDRIYPVTATVDVLFAKPAQRSFIELGVLSARLSNATQEKLIPALKEKAQGIGADAIVILGQNSSGSASLPVAGMRMSVPLVNVQALAIRYQ